MSLRTGTLWGVEGANPEPFSKTIGAIALTAYSAYVIGDATIEYFYDKKRAEKWEERISHTKSSKKSGKEKSSDVPSWARGLKPKPGESGSGFAKRVLDGQYGEGGWSGTGPGSEYNKLKKRGDRGN
ncbi:hypothetical protein ACJVDH_05675 [Pedobacter sp. AW1-32]|uniref:hypothetical protein n=1 Tax=Pedobacter sp. AW1-32 TaxID=3383026 RepID=UPI003FF0ABAB